MCGSTRRNCITLRGGWLASRPSRSDPANRRSYFNIINDLLGRVRPLAISFESLMEERASAKRLMMTVAQIVKYIDAETPIRFLIAETETGFTLLTALYYARLFGVDDRIEISPLFETEEAFERGERVIEEALKSPHYRAYLERQGRLCGAIRIFRFGAIHRPDGGDVPDRAAATAARATARTARARPSSK